MTFAIVAGAVVGLTITFLVIKSFINKENSNEQQKDDDYHQNS